MKKKKQPEGEGLTSSPTYAPDEVDRQIFRFLARERKKQKENERQRTLENTVIVARTKPMPSVFHKVLKPKKKSLQEVWAEEDEAKREREE